MKMTVTMLSEDIRELPKSKRNRNDVVELFYQRLFNIVEHVKFDINTLNQNMVIQPDELDDLYMAADMYCIQMEEVIDKMRAETCSHEHIRGVNGSKVCENCATVIA